MSSVNIDTIDQIIREVAAAEVMPYFRQLKEGDVEMKGMDDPVTKADKECEKKLTLRLKDVLAGSVVVGEESFAEDKSIIERLNDDSFVWVIDPIDGTRNFVAGKPEFAVMVALMKNKKPIAAWIHDPNSGDTIRAEAGAGVWLRGQKMKLATPSKLTGLVGARVKQLIGDSALLASDMVNAPQVHIGSCAAFDYPRVFDGAVTFANAPTPRASFLLYRHTNAWDHIPGWFLHHEAGGYAANWAKEPYDMQSPLCGLLYAPTKEIWGDLHALFSPLMEQALRKTA